MYQKQSELAIIGNKTWIMDVIQFKRVIRLILARGGRKGGNKFPALFPDAHENKGDKNVIRIKLSGIPECC